MNEELFAFLSGQPPAATPLVERVTGLARVVRAEVVDRGGRVVLENATTGCAFGAAWGTNAFALRLDSHPGFASASADTELPAGWVPIDPWPQDALFRRGDDLIRDAVRRAYHAAASR